MGRCYRYTCHSRLRTRVIWIEARIGRAWDTQVGSLTLNKILPRHAVSLNRWKIGDESPAYVVLLRHCYYTTEDVVKRD